MSVEATKPVEETIVPEPTKAIPEQAETAPAVAATEAAAPAAADAPAATEVPAAAGADEAAAVASEEVKEDEAVVEAVPASEGILGYKEPHFFKKFIYSKHFFWFSEEPSTVESLTTFLRTEKADSKHSAAAWARETGKGLIFFAKRAEDKATPAGVINLSEATGVTKEGVQQFSFKVGTVQHRFEATTAKERDSWLLAVEKAVEEAKAIKEDILGRESYKKNLDEYSKPAAVTAAGAAKSSRSKSKEAKKSIDAATATAAAENASRSSSSSGEAAEGTKAAKKDKERSQSRKRSSIFSSLLPKKEDAKEEKKADAEEAKDEAKAAEATSPDAAESSAAAAGSAPAAASTEETATSPTGEKKPKRSSVFGSLFKKSVTSPGTEKTEKEATSDVPPVSETAPKLDEPIENKPIDTAAVTAPADNVDAPAPAATDDTTPATTEAATTKPEKKGGILGFIKKTEAKLEGKKESKEEAKEEATAEAAAQDTVAAAAPAETTTETPATEPAAESTPATKEERPARDGTRRISLFNKTKKETTSDTEGSPETKRERSPLPGIIGNLVRRASKAVKHDSKEKPTADATSEPTKETAAEAAPAATAEPTESKTADVVPDDLGATPAQPATTAVPEVKATA